MSDLLEGAAPYVVRLHTDADLRASIVAWYGRNGIDARNIPWDSGVTLDGNRLTTEVYRRDDAGDFVIRDGDYIPRDLATFTLTELPTGEVAAWIASAAEPVARA